MTEVDLAEFFAEQPRLGSHCGVAIVMATMTPDDRAKFEAALTHSELKHVALESWCRKHKYNLGAQSISRHRRHLCQCDQ